MNICIIGGDKRMALLAERALSDGCRVICCGLDEGGRANGCLHTDSPEEAVRSSDIIILPTPVSRNGTEIFAPLSHFRIGISEVLSSLSREKQVMCGGAAPEIERAIKKSGARFFDYGSREELCIKNAVSTVEGAIELAMHETERTLFGANVLIVGYGRLGRVAAARLQGLGSRVTVSARKQADLCWIALQGNTAVRTSRLAEHISRADIIINTVPAEVIGKKELDRAKSSAVIIDLASPPGGVDFEYSELKGIKAIHALSLPGRVAPMSAAEVIYEAVLQILAENMPE